MQLGVFKGIYPKYQLSQSSPLACAYIRTPNYSYRSFAIPLSAKERANARKQNC